MHKTAANNTVKETSPVQYSIPVELRKLYSAIESAGPPKGER